jgi:hypothetical protein
MLLGGNFLEAAANLNKGKPVMCSGNVADEGLV